MFGFSLSFDSSPLPFHCFSIEGDCHCISGGGVVSGDDAVVSGAQIEFVVVSVSDFDQVGLRVGEGCSGSDAMCADALHTVSAAIACTQSSEALARIAGSDYGREPVVPFLSM